MKRFLLAILGILFCASTASPDSSPPGLISSADINGNKTDATQQYVTRQDTLSGISTLTAVNIPMRHSATTIEPTILNAHRSAISTAQSNPSTLQEKVSTIQSNITIVQPQLGTIKTPQMYGAMGDGANDDTAAIQDAVNAAVGGTLYFSAGKYKISSQINITGALSIQGVPNQTTIILATPNQNGFVVGDGTAETRRTTYNTSIYNINFNPLFGIKAFTSGICIYLNYVAYIDIINCTIYGSDGIANKLHEGVRAFKTSEFNIKNCRFHNLNGIGINAYGLASNALRTVNGRIDSCEFANIADDAIYLGLNAVGITINSPVMYSNQGVNIHVDVITSPSQGANIFILQPDIEIDAPHTAINVTNGASIQIIGGWIGAGAIIGQNALAVASSCNGVMMQGVRLDQCAISLSGTACEIIGCEVTGDNSTTPAGITVNSTATDALISNCRIRQWITYGINFVGKPARCIVSGVIFRSIGVSEINGQSFGGAATPPRITGCQSDTAYVVTMASTLPLHVGRNFIQVTGGATCTNMTPIGIGQRITIQAMDSFGNTFRNGSGSGAIILKNSPTTITQYHTMSFVSDGVSWFEDGRNF